MIPKELTLPKSGKLKTQKVGNGLYVIKGAYDEKLDYFATLKLYTVKADPDDSTDVKRETSGD